MKTLLRIASFLLLSVAVLFLINHGRVAMSPARPSDMPAQAQFMQSGYDVAHLEPTGDWVACGTDRPEQSNWCRVTDARGEVVYEGDYLPVRGQNPLPLDRIELGHVDPRNLWVNGPTEGSPIPIIPLVGGDVLVPVGDREALADRWAGNPQELQTLSGQ